ncbi:YjbQ family protein [Ligilactobacillus sp. WILCCON 0076]|uniref:YjbQ family protein n=1 Tax=Ligilactobacillus ubinensis TaxID=2876789 RepID=A0A9X2FMT5_9LACO|nr:YjbQ family protein [Ligilactobacillus ubinensis]MCP0888035.1 YjbQ family protein [Ligilactobacillus ubinensis]
MKIYQNDIKLETLSRVTYIDITEKVKKEIKNSKIENGICLIQTSHTTCSILFEEYVHDHDFNGDEYLQADLNDILDRLVPRELTENRNYKYPGPKHVEFLSELAKENANYPNDPGTILNGDAHIRGSLFGGNQTFAIKKGILLTGSVGYIYFVDWDQNRNRNRICHILLMGD